MALQCQFQPGVNSSLVNTNDASTLGEVDKFMHAPLTFKH